MHAVRAALALLPELMAARALANTGDILAARDVNCRFSVLPAGGDTCASFAAAWGVTITQLQSLNPSLDCNNFDNKTPYCVSGDITPGSPSSSSSSSSSSPSTATTATSATKATSTTTASASTTISSTTTFAGSPSASPTSTFPGPVQPGIAQNCDSFHKVASGDQCALIEAQYGITAAQFAAWNPYVDSNCTNLWLDYYVCVHVPGATAPPSTSTSTSAQPSPTSAFPSPTQPGIAKDCDTFYKVASGDQCGLIEAKYGITAARFSEWNPYIASDCSNLWVDYYVCVHVPGATRPSSTSTRPNPTPTPVPSGPQPQMPGIVRNCRAFHLVASGDGCNNIDAAAGITLQQFLNWNPSVNAACDNLWLGYYVCVGV